MHPRDKGYGKWENQGLSKAELAKKANMSEEDYLKKESQIRKRFNVQDDEEIPWNVVAFIIVDPKDLNEEDYKLANELADECCK